MDNKNNNLRKIRQDTQKQKTLNLTMKNLKEIEHSEDIKRKVSKVKQLKERMRRVRNSDASEDDFIQQGNFVMEQQLKMVIMRSRLQNVGPKSKQTNSTISNKRKSSSFSHSFYSEDKIEDRKKLDEINAKPINTASATVNVRARSTIQNETIEGEERQIVNTRAHRRSKGYGIGAYIRDPSYVHGVFPEEYYPIETKGGGNFKFFPPL